MGFHTRQLVRYIIDTFELPMQQEELTKQLQAGYNAIFPSTKLLSGDSEFF